MIDQEVLNQMMRYPFEVAKKAEVSWNTCPICKEKYCGDGIDLCAECENAKASKD